MKQQNKVALITGASRGIGRGIALRMAEEGYTIIINSRTADPDMSEKGAYEVYNTIKKAGGRSVVYRADISSSEERKGLVEFVESKFGRLDLLVNNAGIEPPALDMLDSDEARYDNVFKINLKGPYFLTQQLAKRMSAWREDGVIGGGYIIFITSVQAYMTAVAGAEYTMTKAALSMAMRNYACRLAEYNINVFEICPGVILSDMTAVHAQHIEKMIESGKVLQKRWGYPEDIAALVSAIARGDLDYSTGTTIEVGGGLGLRRL